MDDYRFFVEGIVDCLGPESIHEHTFGEARRLSREGSGEWYDGDWWVLFGRSMETPAVRQVYEVRVAGQGGVADRGCSLDGRHNPSAAHIRSRADYLLALLAPAYQIEPGLLRELHRMVFGFDSAAVELSAWNREGWDARGTWSTRCPRGQRDLWRQRWRQLPVPERRLALVLLERWHRSVGPGIWEEELLWALGEAPQLRIGLEGESELAEAFLRGALKLGEAEGEQSTFTAGVRRWLLDVEFRSGKAIGKVCPELEGRIAYEKEPSSEARESQRSGESGRWSWALWTNSLRIQARWQAGELRKDPFQGVGPEPFASAVGRLEPSSSDPRVRVDGVVRTPTSLPVATKGQSRALEYPLNAEEQKIELRTRRERVELEMCHRPSWANRFGIDRYGVWADVSLNRVTQRFRWIPPGSFKMGSPETEPGRREEEGPRHLVHLSQGYWLASTPCTQALWMSVMGENESYFEGDEQRPVEQVSWDAVRVFLAKLSKEESSVNAYGLPTEAQWEYACRAGHGGMSYAGEFELDRPSQELNAIAWGPGNSDGETHEVAQLRPNHFGLYDMLGNVWEWCEDDWESSYGVPEMSGTGHGYRRDPLVKNGGSKRVVRGGSWYNGSWCLRSACRLKFMTGFRHSFLGFRLVRRVVGSVSTSRKSSRREAVE